MRLRHLSFKSTALRFWIVLSPSFLISAHLPPPHSSTPLTSDLVSSRVLHKPHVRAAKPQPHLHARCDCGRDPCRSHSLPQHTIDFAERGNVGLFLHHFFPTQPCCMHASAFVCKSRTLPKEARVRFPGTMRSQTVSFTDPLP